MKPRTMILLLALCSLAAGPAVGQDEQVILRLDEPVITKLAVSNYYPRSLPNPETETALTTLNKVLLNDLKFSSFFEIPSRSFYPPGDAKLPQEIDFDAWTPALYLLLSPVCCSTCSVCLQPTVVCRPTLPDRPTLGRQRPTSANARPAAWASISVTTVHSPTSRAASTP